MDTDAAVKKLFASHAKAFDKLDFKAQAQTFAETFIMAGPKGVVSQSKEDFLAKAPQAVEFYKGIGMSSARILSSKEVPISLDYTMITIHWGVTFQKTGDKMTEFDISYIVHTTIQELRIIMAITHQDEEETMKELGVLAAQ